jgi:hypothetical protein
MARLQILELPAAAGDDRPPFILVLDQVADDETERIIASQESFNGVAAKSGARAIAVFHGMTIDIPANDTSAYVSAALCEQPEVQRRLDHAEKRCYDEALSRVLNLPTEPEVMDANQPNPGDWLHGYRCGVLAAKSALRPRDEETSKP